MANFNKYNMRFILTLTIIFLLSSLGTMSTVHSNPSHTQTIEAVQHFNDHTIQSTPDQEAQWTVNEYQSISQAIQMDQKSKVVPPMSIYNMSISAHIKAIAKIIGEETTKLVELIMPGKPQTTQTQQQVTTIINNLDNQRKTLNNYLSVQQSNTTTEKFDASKYDRVKNDNQFQVYAPH